RPLLALRLRPPRLAALLDLVHVPPLHHEMIGVVGVIRKGFTLALDRVVDAMVLTRGDGVRSAPS
ncbi:MAG: hypothetical protein V3V08_02450, partial [Nannocystaceae bacterium]